MKFTLRTLAACAALAAVPLASQAQNNTGLYIGGSLGQSHWTEDDTFGLDRNDIGGKAYLGYEFTPNFAAELGYARLGKFDSSSGSIKAEGVFLDGVAKIPFTPQWSGLARLGVFGGRLNSNAPAPFNGDDDGTSFKAGLGVQYNLNQQASIRGEWERYRFDAFEKKSDTDMLSVGFNYKF